jgi:hypothetical protein
MRKFSVLILLLFLFVFPRSVLAIYDPLSVPNNRFGIHITQEADLEEAASIVNSSGGDWGYVTLVIRKDERDSRRWQDVFNRLRRLHLIPLIRLATIQQGEGWEKPSEGEIDGWVEFLGSLNWPMQNMYVIVGNEPNHEKEWGGEISPEGYANYLDLFIDKARAKSNDFFILPAALDFSASSDGKSLDASSFLTGMLKVMPDVLEKVDGWNSHSYPNPGFSGSERASGRGTVASYIWELSYLKRLGVNKDLPVFITETGWVHSLEGEQIGNLSPEKLGPKFIYAYEGPWNNPKVVAVTPFIFTYQDPPFDVFSWKDKDGKFYPFVEVIKSISKPKGDPIQKTSGEIITAFVPPYVEVGQDFTLALFVKNTGQSIWNEEDFLLIRDLDNNLEISKILSFPTLEPGGKQIVLFEAKAPLERRLITGNLVLLEKGKMITNSRFYKASSYITGDFLEQLISIRNGLSSALWLLRINLLGS